MAWNFLGADYLLHLIIMIGIYVMVSASLNLMIGYTGMLNLGHVGFFGIGAYTSVLLTHPVYGLGLPFSVGLLGGAAMALLGGYFIGIPSLKLRGDYLAIATLGFGEIMRAVFKNWQSLTRGPLGIPAIPKATIFGYTLATKESMAMVVIVATLICLIVLWKIIHSPFGRTLKAIREDEIAAISLGKEVRRYKMTALCISACIAGIAGVFYAHYISFIDPTTFSFSESVIFVCMVILGGMGSFWGSVLGAIVIILLPQPLRFLGFHADIVGALRQILFAAILITMMLWKPQGLISEETITEEKETKEKAAESGTA